MRCTEHHREATGKRIGSRWNSWPGWHVAWVVALGARSPSRIAWPMEWWATSKRRSAMIRGERPFQARSPGLEPRAQCSMAHGGGPSGRASHPCMPDAVDGPSLLASLRKNGAEERSSRWMHLPELHRSGATGHRRGLATGPGSAWTGRCAPCPPGSVRSWGCGTGRIGAFRRSRSRWARIEAGYLDCTHVRCSG